MRPKILVGVVSNEDHEYCMDHFLKSLNQFTYDNFEVIFADDSKDFNFRKSLRDKGHNVFKGDEKIIMKQFLRKNYDYLFLLDSRILAPKDIIEKLLSHDKDITTGVYLNNMLIDKRLVVTPNVFFTNGNTLKLATKKEVMKNKLIEIGDTDLRCCLIKRDVIVNTEDSVFPDALVKGFKAFVDTSMKCFNFNYPEHDPRNEFYMWNDKYKNRMFYSFDVKFG